MLLPLRTDIPLRSRPWMNYVIILANVVVSVWARAAMLRTAKAIRMDFEFISSVL